MEMLAEGLYVSNEAMADDNSGVFLYCYAGEGATAAMVISCVSG